MISDAAEAVYDALEEADKAKILAQALKYACEKSEKTDYWRKWHYYQYIQKAMFNQGLIVEDKCSTCIHCGCIKEVVRGSMDCDPAEYYCTRDNDGYFMAEYWAHNDECPEYKEGLGDE